MYFNGPSHMVEQDDQLEHTYSSYVRIRDAFLKTCRRRWTIGRSGEKGSGISVLAARHDDDDIIFQKKYLISLSNNLTNSHSNDLKFQRHVQKQHNLLCLEFHVFFLFSTIEMQFTGMQIWIVEICKFGS